MYSVAARCTITITVYGAVHKTSIALHSMRRCVRYPLSANNCSTNTFVVRAMLPHPTLTPIPSCNQQHIISKDNILCLEMFWHLFETLKCYVYIWNSLNVLLSFLHIEKFGEEINKRHSKSFYLFDILIAIVDTTIFLFIYHKLLFANLIRFNSLLEYNFMYINRKNIFTV